MAEQGFKKSSLADFIGNYFKKLQLNTIQIGAVIAGNSGLNDENEEKCLNQLKNEFRHFFHRFDPYTTDLKTCITDELHYNSAIDTDYLFSRIEEQFSAIIIPFRRDVYVLNKNISINDSEWKNTTQPRDIYLHHADRELERYRDEIMQIKELITDNDNNNSKSCTKKKTKERFEQQIIIPDNVLNELQKILIQLQNEKRFDIVPNVIPILWGENKQLLRELLTFIKQKHKLEIGVDKIALLLFKDEQGNPFKLAKNYPKGTLKEKQLKTVLENFSDLSN